MSAHEQLMRLSDFLVEDIMAMSDEEILDEAEEDGFDLEETRREMVAMVDRIEAGQEPCVS
jgi:hypothetical protein